MNDPILLQENGIILGLVVIIAVLITGGLAIVTNKDGEDVGWGCICAAIPVAIMLIAIIWINNIKFIPGW